MKKFFARIKTCRDHIKSVVKANEAKKQKEIKLKTIEKGSFKQRMIGARE